MTWPDSCENRSMASTKKSKPDKKYFSPPEANATLPLVRAITTDIVNIARDLQERRQRLDRATGAGASDEAHAAELRQAEADFERDSKRLLECQTELENLGVELKDFLSGLVDFPSYKDGRVVYLCWRLGEPEVAHWHELNTGFGGRQSLYADVSRPS
jgi:hypothetical protein